MLRHRDLLFVIVPIDVTIGRGKQKLIFKSNYCVLWTCVLVFQQNTVLQHRGEAV